MGLQFARCLVFGIALLAAVAGSAVAQSACSVPCVVKVVDIACSQALCGENTDAENRVDYLCNPECTKAIVGGMLKECLAAEKLPRIRRRLISNGLKTLVKKTCRANGPFGKRDDDDDDDRPEKNVKTEIPRAVLDLLERRGVLFPAAGNEIEKDDDDSEAKTGGRDERDSSQEDSSSGGDSKGDSNEKVENSKKESGGGTHAGRKSGGSKKGWGKHRQSAGRKELEKNVEKGEKERGENTNGVEEVDQGNVGTKLEETVEGGAGRKSGGKKGKGHGKHRETDDSEDKKSSGEKKGKETKRGGKKGKRGDDDDSDEPSDDDSFTASAPPATKETGSSEKEESSESVKENDDDDSPSEDGEGSDDDSDDDSYPTDPTPAPSPIAEDNDDADLESEVAAPPADVPDEDFDVLEFDKDVEESALAPVPGVFTGGMPYENDKDGAVTPPEVPFPALETMEEFAVEPSYDPWFAGAAAEPSFKRVVEVPAADDEQIESFLDSALGSVFG